MCLRWMSTLPCFSVIFTKGDNFSDSLFALQTEALPKRGLFLKEEFAPTGANPRSKFFFMDVTPDEMGDKSVTEKVASPDSVPCAQSKQINE